MDHHPTPYPEVNQIISILHTCVSAILGDHLVGMYLYGSLSSGDFDPRHSDIDFLFVIEQEIDDQTVDQLRAMHTDLWADGPGWAQKLEGCYISKRAIRRRDPTSPPCPQVNEGRFFVEPEGADWVIQRHIIRECGVVISGPPPITLIDPVTPDDIRAAIKEIMTSWWEPMLSNTEFLDQGDGYRAFSIQTMCRVMYTLHHGTVTSKPVSVRWALSTLDPRWSPMLERALAWYGDSHVATVSEVQDFIRYAIETMPR